MEFDDQLRRFFGTCDLAAVTPGAMAGGIERMQVELGRETDQIGRLAIWSILHLLGAAPDPDLAFADEADRAAVRAFADLWANSASA